MLKNRFQKIVTLQKKVRLEYIANKIKKNVQKKTCVMSERFWLMCANKLIKISFLNYFTYKINFSSTASLMGEMLASVRIKSSKYYWYAKPVNPFDPPGPWSCWLRPKKAAGWARSAAQGPLRSGLEDLDAAYRSLWQLATTVWRQPHTQTHRYTHKHLPHFSIIFFVHFSIFCSCIFAALRIFVHQHFKEHIFI